jgi:hypothetical protein
MHADWQNLVAMGVVAAAIGYLIWYIGRSLQHKAAGCGSGCGGCKVSSPNSSLGAAGRVLPLVTLKLPTGQLPTMKLPTGQLSTGGAGPESRDR